MQIGKTASSISKTEIFEMYSETEVLTAVFPEITSIPCKISSPFRADSNPSFSIYLNDSKHICFKDFGDTSSHGSLLDLLCKFWDCSFHQVFDKILEVMAKTKGTDVAIKPKQIKTLTRKEASELTKIQVAVRPWRDYDYKYWESYGIGKQWLKYCNIYPISHKIVFKKDKETGKEKKHIFAASKYTFVYVEKKEGKLSLKIYSPFSKNHKWCSQMDKSVISLWTKVPEYGDKIILCSSVKDSLCISNNLHIPAIAPQGEGFGISDAAIKELKRRYKQVFISYDGDEAGRKDATSLSEHTGFPIIQCPILETPSLDRDSVKWLIKEGLEKKAKAKDWSDIFLYFGKERFIQEFTTAFERTKNKYSLI